MTLQLHGSHATVAVPTKSQAQARYKVMPPHHSIARPRELLPPRKANSCCPPPSPNAHLQRSRTLTSVTNNNPRAIQGWTSSIALAPGCMCATTLGPIPTTSIAQLTSGTVCNPSISATAPLYSIRSLGSGGSGDGLAIPYCIIKGTKVPEVTQAFGQCYGHGDCPEGDYIVNGGTGNPSCA